MSRFAIHPRGVLSLFATVILLGLLSQQALLAGTGEKPIAPARPSLLALEQVSGWTAPRVDVARLLEQDEADLARPGVPYRIGFPMATDLSPAKSGTWEDLPEGGRIWRLKVRTEGALWVVLGFDRFRLQAGGKLWVYDPAGHTVMGPYTAGDMKRHGQLWFPPIAGDTLVVEVDWPEALRDEVPDLHLGTVSHGYRKFGVIGGAATEDFGDSGACNIDVACPLGADWQDQKRGVVMLLSGGSAFCSASLINTTADDCRPYVLTAAHCTAGPSTTFAFNFERPACASGTPPPATNQTVTGATVLANFGSSDFTLLEMDAAPPEAFNAYFSGWSHDALPATETHVIHHPSGDAKKISLDDEPPINGSNWGTNHWRVIEYDLGTTEPGSSGSPLFDQNHRIIGQLHGGTASCSSDTWDEFGKVAASWTGGGSVATRLSDWLDPEATGALVMDGVDWSTCDFQPAGSVGFTRALYACSDTLTLTLRDDSLEGSLSQDVTVTSNTEPSPETVTLFPVEPGSGRFAGTFPTTSVPAAGGDGQLSVSHGDTVTVHYVDADDGQGGINVPREASAQVDCLDPEISNVEATNVTGNSATVTWDTNEPADSTVHYGPLIPPSSTTSTGARVTTHGVDLTGLDECTTYYYSVESADEAGNSASDDNSGAYHTFETGKNVTPTYTATDTPVGIPDNTTVTSQITVTDANTVVDVNVQFDITHTYDADLDIFLIGPNGTRVELSTDNGADGNNFTNTIFDDEAATSVTAGAAPFAGSFRPETPLSALDGILSNGTWTLEVSDDAGVDVGTINSFKVILSYPPQACGPSLAYQAHSYSDTCHSTEAGGDGIADPGEDLAVPVQLKNNGTDPTTGITAVVSTTTPGVTVAGSPVAYPDLDPGESAYGASSFVVSISPSVPCGTLISLQVVATANEGSWNGSFSILVGAPGSAMNTYNSTDVPKPINDLSTVTSTLSVSDTSAVLDVNVGLTLTHTFDGDLDIFLIGPNGSRVELSTDNGGTGENYTGTVFDDEAATSITAGTPPYVGSFRPEGPLSALDGIPANGTWTLEITDDAGVDTGTLLSWNIVLTTVTPPVCGNCAAVAPQQEVLNIIWSDLESFSWDASPGASYYNVYRGDPPSLPDLLDGDPDSCKRASPVTNSVTGITETAGGGTYYWYIVRSANAGGEGPVAPGQSQESTGACP